MFENPVTEGSRSSDNAPIQSIACLQGQIDELEEEVRMLSSENKFFAAWISNVLKDVVGSPGFPKDIDEALNTIANGGDPYD